MDTGKIEKFMNSFGLHILSVVAGLVLLLNPDGAAALVTRLIGRILVAPQPTDALGHTEVIDSADRKSVV